MALVTALALLDLVAATTTSLPPLLSTNTEDRTEYLGVAGGFAAAITVAWPVWRVILCIQRQCFCRSKFQGPDVEPGLCDKEDQGESHGDSGGRWAMPVDQGGSRVWPGEAPELVDLEAKETDSAEMGAQKAFKPSSAASQLRKAKRRQDTTVEEVKEGDEEVCDEPVGTEAGVGAVSDAQDVPNSRHVQAVSNDKQLAAFSGHALQLRNFRSLDGKASSKQERGKAETERADVTLPGSVPGESPVDQFVADPAWEGQVDVEPTVSKQGSADHKGDIGVVPVEAGRSYARDVQKALHVQASDHLKSAVSPALQLRNFRSSDGNASGKQGPGKAEKEATVEHADMTLPGSVPTETPVDHLVADSAWEGQADMEPTVSKQESAGHKGDTGVLPAEAGGSSARAVHTTNDRQSAASPALQLRHLRFLQGSVSPETCKDKQDGSGTSTHHVETTDQSHRVSVGKGETPFVSSPSGLASRVITSQGVAPGDKDDGMRSTKSSTSRTASLSGQKVEQTDLQAEMPADQDGDTRHEHVSPALNLRDLRSCMALHQQRREELEKCVANFAQSDRFHDCIMQTEEAHALLQQLMPQGKSSDSPKRPYLLSVALKRGGTSEPTIPKSPSQSSRP